MPNGREVTSVSIIMDRETGRPRGFAFVEMATAEGARPRSRSSTERTSTVVSCAINEARERDARGPRPAWRSGGPGGPGGGGPGGGGYAAAAAAATAVRRAPVAPTIRAPAAWWLGRLRRTCRARVVLAARCRPRPAAASAGRARAASGAVVRCTAPGGAPAATPADARTRTRKRAATVERRRWAQGRKRRNEDDGW